MTKQIARSKIALQCGARAYYAEVALEVTEGHSQNPPVSVEFACTESRWLAGAHFGIAYAYEKTTHGARRPPLVIRIVELHGHEVDTTEAVVACACAHAFFDAIGAEPLARPNVKPDTGEITFPK